MPNHARNNSGQRDYRANALHPSFGNRTVPGMLALGFAGVRFEFESGQVTLPWQGLKLHLGGHNHEQLFVQHPDHQDWSIYTSDLRILDDPTLQQNPELARQIKAFQKAGQNPLKLLLFAAVALLLPIGLIALALSQKDRVVRYAANQIPAAWEQTLGNQLFEQIQKGGTLTDDPKLKAQLDAATKTLVATIPDARYSFNFHILADTNINAFALPGGNVVVHAGLLRAAKRPEEIAGVLAHEIAHVTQRQGLRKAIDAAGLYLIVQAVFGDATGMLAVIADSSEFLLRQKYSRDFEREADDVGWEYLVNAGIDPRGMIDFFRLLKDQQEDQGQVAALFGTHPATNERIERLEAKWKKLEQRPGSIK